MSTKIKNVLILIFVTFVFAFLTFEFYMKNGNQTFVEDVTIAILAKDKAHTLPLYLESLENQTFDKTKSYLYIRTNNNNDDSANILKAWIRKVGHEYKAVYFDDSDIVELKKNYKQHEWNAERFKVLGKIRQDSLNYAKEHNSHYFVADCDNFIQPNTIKKLIETNLTIVAPFLRSTKTSLYSNFHAAVDQNGYYSDSSHSQDIILGKVKGLFDVPVVHSTYLIRNDVLDKMSFDDQSSRSEYLIFSDNARKQHIPQYLDNRELYGRISMAVNKEEFEKEYWLRGFYKPTLTKTDESLVFVILCHIRNEDDKKSLKKAYDSVIKYYPNDKVVLIDDNSSITPSSKDFPKVSIVRSEYPGCGELLPYHYFLKHKWADKMIFLHDSMFLCRPFFKEELNSPLKFHWDFDMHEWDDDSVINNLLGCLKSAKELIEFNILQKNEWNGCFGVTSIISLSTLEKIENKYSFTQSLIKQIKTRDDRMALERIFAILCFNENYLTKNDCSNFGSIQNFPCWFVKESDVDYVTGSTDSAIIKIWKGR